MIRLRIMLFLIMVVLGVGAFWVSGREWDILFAAGSLAIIGILFFSAFVIFISSFMQVGVLPSGQLCYSPDNWYWRAMDSMYNNWGGRGTVSLCEAFWRTVLVILSGVSAIGVVAFLIGVIPMIVYAFIKDPRGSLIVTSSTIGILSLVGGTMWLDSKYRWFGYVWKSVVALMLIALLVALPIWEIMQNNEISLWPAVLIYLKYAGIIIGVVVGVIAMIVGFVCGSIKAFPVLRNSVLWQGYFFIKKETCPMLVACPMTGSSKNNS